MYDLQINDRIINDNSPTFLIAEIGINHGGNLDVAKRLIDSASRTGCDAVKFQTYRTEKRAPSGHQSIYNVLKECELPPHAFEDLKQHALGVGLQFFSTPFDEESIEILESIGIEFYNSNSAKSRFPSLPEGGIGLGDASQSIHNFRFNPTRSWRRWDAVASSLSNQGARRPT